MQCQTAQSWQWIVSKYSHGFLRNFRKKISKHFIWFSLYYIYVSGQPSLKKVRPCWILVVSWLCIGKKIKTITILTNVYWTPVFGKSLSLGKDLWTQEVQLCKYSCIIIVFIVKFLNIKCIHIILLWIEVVWG